MLAGLYILGKGVPHSEAQAFKWMSKAGNQGIISAQTMLGTAYAGGIGVPQDYAKALGWYRKAADQGDAEAQVSIGEMYALGQGAPQNYAEALKWFRKAAELGFDGAQFRLGLAFGTAKAYRATAPQPWRGIAKPPTRDSAVPRSTSRSCTPSEPACRMTSCKHMCGLRWPPPVFLNRTPKAEMWPARAATPSQRQ